VEPCALRKGVIISGTGHGKTRTWSFSWRCCSNSTRDEGCAGAPPASAPACKKPQAGQGHCPARQPQRPAPGRGQHDSPPARLHPRLASSATMRTIRSLRCVSLMKPAWWTCLMASWWPPSAVRPPDCWGQDHWRPSKPARARRPLQWRRAARLLGPFMRSSKRSPAELPAKASTGRASDLGDCIVELRKNYRFAAKAASPAQPRSCWRCEELSKCSATRRSAARQFLETVAAPAALKPR